jgi:RNA polymerase sigma-70 factor (ECF subfamily)
MTAHCATESAWLQLSTDLRHFIRRRVVDDHVADDLLQETFLRIHRGINQLGRAGRLTAWVYRIARNVIHDHYRACRHEQSLAEIDPPDASEKTDELLRHADRWLDELIQQLPETYRQAVIWGEIEGLTQREIAKRLGLSLSGAKSRVQRGRALLKQALDQCCTFHVDHQGNVYDCDPKPDRTVCRDCDEASLRVSRNDG